MVKNAFPVVSMGKYSNQIDFEEVKKLVNHYVDKAKSHNGSFIIFCVYLYVGGACAYHENIKQRKGKYNNTMKSITEKNRELFKAKIIQQFKNPDSPIHVLMLGRPLEGSKRPGDNYLDTVEWGSSEHNLLIEISRHLTKDNSVSIDDGRDYFEEFKEISFINMDSDSFAEEYIYEDMQGVSGYIYLQEAIVVFENKIMMSLNKFEINIVDGEFTKIKEENIHPLVFDIKDNRFIRSFPGQKGLLAWEYLRREADRSLGKPIRYIQYQPTLKERQEMVKGFMASEGVITENIASLVKALYDESQEETGMMRLSKYLREQTKIKK